MLKYQRFRDFLFKFDAENIHNLAENFLAHFANKPIIQDVLLKKFYYQDSMLYYKVCGIPFNNPIGLAAGFDKNATMLEGLATLGFGFLELGTITKLPQSGNPKPRLFRHIEEKSIQNAMGFNNDGADAIKERLKNSYPFCLPIGINFGKNKQTKQEDALSDYEKLLQEFLTLGDYYVFNLSSPNTLNLRDLQNESFVGELFNMARTYTNKPLFLKIAPDISTDSMLQVCKKAIDTGASGIIATNTTLDYSVVKNPKDIGGISGAALRQKSSEVFKILAQNFFKETTLIAVGGISNAMDAYERILHGASLVQVYTGFIFEGPSICKNINQELTTLLKADGFSNIKEAIGANL